MRISKIDIADMTTTVRRHEALLRYARYMLIFNLAILLWAAIPQLFGVKSLTGLREMVTNPNWTWAGIVLGSVGATYLVLAHRLWWAYAVVFLVQVGYFFIPSPDKQIFLVAITMPYSVLAEPAMRPLAPLATELAVMTIGFCYVMIVYCFYSAAWVTKASGVPPDAYGRRMSLLEPLRPSRLLDTVLPGHKSQSVSFWEAAIFSLSSVLFVAASMGFFYGIRRVQTAFEVFATKVQATCMREVVSEQTADAIVACLAQDYPWNRVALDLGVPIAIAAVCLLLANRLRHIGRRHFVHRLAQRKLTPTGSTLFLRAFRDDQVRIRRASRNMFSFVFDLGRTPATLDELMLERLDGHGDLIAIGNPQDRKGSARLSPWGAQRLYVDDAHWQETVTMLAREANRIVLCVDASEGVRWEIAHVLRNGHAGKTLFFLNPSLDGETRTRLLTGSFGIASDELQSLKVDDILALRASDPDQLNVMSCAKPEREAYLVAARLAYAQLAGKSVDEAATRATRPSVL